MCGLISLPMLYLNAGDEEQSATSTVLPSRLLESRRGFKVSVFFLKWYLEELYNCAYDPPSGQVMNRFARAICYFKYFLPPETVIEPRTICTNADELQGWITYMTKLSNTVETNVLNFVVAKKAAKERSASEVDGPVKKKRNIKTYPLFESMYKFLNTETCVDEYDLLMPANVHDKATKPAGFPAMRYDRVRQFRK